MSSCEVGGGSNYPAATQRQEVGSMDIFKWASRKGGLRHLHSYPMGSALCYNVFLVL